MFQPSRRTAEPQTSDFLKTAASVWVLEPMFSAPRRGTLSSTWTPSCSSSGSAAVSDERSREKETCASNLLTANQPGNNPSNPHSPAGPSEPRTEPGPGKGEDQNHTMMQVSTSRGRHTQRKWHHSEDMAVEAGPTRRRPIAASLNYDITLFVFIVVFIFVYIKAFT